MHIFYLEIFLLIPVSKKRKQELPIVLVLDFVLVGSWIQIEKLENDDLKDKNRKTTKLNMNGLVPLVLVPQ